MHIVIAVQPFLDYYFFELWKLMFEATVFVLFLSASWQMFLSAAKSSHRKKVCDDRLRNACLPPVLTCKFMGLAFSYKYS